MAYAPATEAALIFSSEPLWAALFASIFLGESLTLNSGIGGLVILAGCLVAQLPKETFGGLPAIDGSPAATKE